MASVQALLEEGNLQEATRALEREVAGAPDDAGRRFMLFELYLYAERHDAADKELQALAKRHPDLAGGANHLSALLDAERKRWALIEKGEGQPDALVAPPTWAGALLAAHHARAQGRHDIAAQAHAAALAEAPSVQALVDGESVEAFRDADDLLSPCLEVVVPGQYFWVPYAQIRRIELHPAKTAIDMIWRPAFVEVLDGPSGDLWIPGQYVGSGPCGGLVALGRMTTFEYNEEVRRGFGQRDFSFREPGGEGETMTGMHSRTEIRFALAN